MQLEVLYGARLSAVARAFIPLFFMLVMLLANDDKLDGTRLWLVIGAMGFAFWQARGAIRPKQLTLDREGLVYQPPFSTQTTRIQWPQVVGFDIKGSGKERKLVCRYQISGDTTTKTLNLGDSWSVAGKDLFADKLENVCAHLETSRRRFQLSTQSAAVSAQRPLIEVASKTTVQSGPQSKPKPQVAASPARSGQVYASQPAAIKPPPVSFSNSSRSSSSKIAGWALLGAGAGVGAVSAFGFMKACRNGLCGQGLWDVPDVRLWIYFAVWSACVWAVWAGMKRLA